jgi:DNA-binding NarL/FixJ family response regulator
MEEPNERIPTAPGLTWRQNQVLHWASQGKSNWEIGRIIDRSEATVKKNFQSIFRCLQAQNRIVAINTWRERLPGGLAG